VAEDAHSYLYVPAHRQALVLKACSGSTGADVVIVDLEDGVPVSARSEAERILTALKESDCHTRVLARIRAGRDARAEDVSLVPAWFDGVLLAKAENAVDVDLTTSAIRSLGRSWDMWLLIESARGVQELPSLLSTPTPIEGIMLGAGDLSADLALAWPLDERVLDHARLQAVYGATAAGVRHVVDSPEARIEPDAEFVASARRARALGVTGKCAIHPAQLPAIHEAYAVEDSDLAWARAVLNTADGAQRLGDDMTDEATKRLARRIINKTTRKVTNGDV
jgi:citrate lyase beta subunit